MIKLSIKDLKIFLTDRQAIGGTFLLPIALISLFAFVFGGFGGGSDQIDPINLLVTDQDQSVLSRQLISALDSSGSLILEYSTKEEAIPSIEKGNHSAALIIYSGYADSIASRKRLPIELLFDRAKQVEIAISRQVISSSLRNAVQKERERQDGIQELERKIESSIEESIRFKLTSVVGEQKDANLGVIQAAAGTAILMLLFSVADLGTSVLREKESGTLHRLLATPLTMNTILLGKMLTSFLVGVVQLAVMFVFTWLVFGLDIMTNLPAVIIMILAVAFAISGFGIFLASIAKTRQQAQSMGTVIILIMSAVGGSIMPLFVLPAIMKKVAVFSVNYWGVQGFYDIFWRDLALIEILPRAGVLIGIGLLMSLISLRLFQRNMLRLI